MVLSQMICSKLPVEITTDKGIVRIYKYDQNNCPDPSPNTIFFIPQFFDDSIQIQHNIDYDASTGGNYVASAGLDQINDYCGDIDGKDNDDSQ